MLKKPILSLYIILFGLSAIALQACGGEKTPENLEEHVQMLVDEDRYEEALDLLRDEDDNDQQVRAMLRDTHLIYALHLTYGSTMHMTERMPDALRHYRRVLELDPANERARAEIDQIESIYRQMNRPIPEGVAE